LSSGAQRITIAVCGERRRTVSKTGTVLRRRRRSYADQWNHLEPASSHVRLLRWAKNRGPMRPSKAAPSRKESSDTIGTADSGSDTSRTQMFSKIFDQDGRKPDVMRAAQEGPSQTGSLLSDMMRASSSEGSHSLFPRIDSPHRHQEEPITLKWPSEAGGFGRCASEDSCREPATRTRRHRYASLQEDQLQPSSPGKFLALGWTLQPPNEFSSKNHVDARTSIPVPGQHICDVTRQHICDCESVER